LANDDKARDGLSLLTLVSILNNSQSEADIRCVRYACLSSQSTAPMKRSAETDDLEIQQMMHVIAASYQETGAAGRARPSRGGRGVARRRSSAASAAASPTAVRFRLYHEARLTRDGRAVWGDPNPNKGATCRRVRAAGLVVMAPKLTTIGL